ncbi:hypothetical protein CTZ05_05420 [Acinetobacter baumannii]|nr:hypothetical protein [Acinetobacter baumannii]
MLLYGYNFFVVDHNWDYLLPLDEFYKKLLNADFSEPNCTANEELLSATHRWFQAKKLAEKIGWEGDFTRGPYVFFYQIQRVLTLNMVLCSNNTIMVVPSLFHPLNLNTWTNTKM